jgi:hypothetical protein
MGAYPIQPEVFTSQAASNVFGKFGSYMLPVAYPEGAPTHPSYPAGHSAIAGACATVLKAFFNESFVIPKLVQASADGLSLLPFSGRPLTLTAGGELNKLAANIGMAWLVHRMDGLCRGGREARSGCWRMDGLGGRTSLGCDGGFGGRGAGVASPAGQWPSPITSQRACGSLVCRSMPRVQKVNWAGTLRRPAQFGFNFTALSYGTS